MAQARFTAEVAQASELLERFFPNGKLGGLSFSGKPPGAVGQYVDLTVVVRKPARNFQLKTQLAWARHKGGKQLTPQFGLDFVSTDEAVVARLMAFARAELSAYSTRFEPRIPVEWPVRLTHGSVVRREFLADISPGGAFVRTWDPIDLNEKLELSFRWPLTLRSLNVSGRVAWVRRSGGDSGMGIEFFEMEPAVRERFNGLLAKLPNT